MLAITFRIEVHEILSNYPALSPLGVELIAPPSITNSYSKTEKSAKYVSSNNPSNSVNMSSNPQPTSSSGAAYPPNSYTRSEAEAAEAALAYNGAVQTTSAGQPQPTTPQRIPSNHYVGAALQLGANSRVPYLPPLQGQEGSTDSATSAGHEEDAAAAPPPPPLSRGTTRAVLEKMASPDFGSELGKRMGREGEARTNLIPITTTESPSGVAAAADRGDNEKAAKPEFNRQQSWSQEDVKRMMMMERLMGPVGEEDGGYSSAGGGRT